jgi:hypothetical protein
MLFVEFTEMSSPKCFERHLSPPAETNAGAANARTCSRPWMRNGYGAQTLFFLHHPEEK